MLEQKLYFCSRTPLEFNSDDHTAKEPALTAGSPGCNPFANAGRFCANAIFLYNVSASDSAQESDFD
jgi:hypothetical protein